MEGPVRIILTSLLLFAYWPTAHANEPATIVAVEGAVTVHGQRSIDKRQASRGGRLDSASVISIPVGGMARLRFSDLRGIEYSLPPGTYTLTKARQLAQGARYSTFDRVKSFLHVTMGDQVSPIDAAAYLPVFTRSDEARFNIIWPAEWFGNTKPRLRYRDAGSAERRLEAVGPVVALPVSPGLTMWVLETQGPQAALARGFVQREPQRPAELTTKRETLTIGEQIIAAYEAGYYRDAIRLLRDERKKDAQPDFVFESSLAPRLPISMIDQFARDVGKLASGTRPCTASPNLLVIQGDFVGILPPGDPLFASGLSQDAVVYALTSNATNKSAWSGVTTVAGGLAYESEGAATSVLVGLWLKSDGQEKSRLDKLGTRVERLGSHDCLVTGPR